MISRKVRIRQHERGLWFRHGDFRRLLEPGAHRFWCPLWSCRRDRVEVASTLATRFEHPLLDVMLAHTHVRDSLHVVDLTDVERALVWKDERLAYVLGPGRHAFWKTPYRLYVETFRVDDRSHAMSAGSAVGSGSGIGIGNSGGIGNAGVGFRFDHPRLQVILKHPEATKWLDGVQVEAGAVALLYRDGVLIDRLGEGLHVFWKGTGKVACKVVDLREQVADVAGQEIMTADKVSLRVNLMVTHQVSDPVRAATVVADHAQALYREAQLTLRAAVGTRTLDALLADKESVGSEVRLALSARTAEFGVAVRSVGLRDVVLPGDMKTLLNQVIAAQKEAEANLIRRREETASVRSQANTARLLAESPHLARLKELELLKEVLSGTSATFVFGEGDLAGQIRSLVAQRNGAAAPQS
jgi:regulator of protease activity HflC (stomatin/prohibitin superfamily)